MIWLLALLFAMSDSKAATEANKIWGSVSYIGSVRNVPFAVNWTREIGFYAPGCKRNPQVMGSAFNIWDDAFAALPADRGVATNPDTLDGKWKGTIKLHMDLVPSTDPNDRGSVVGVQPIIDNSIFGAVQAVASIPSGYDFPLDTTMLMNGPHVWCASMLHPDQSYARSVAVVFFVGN